MSKLCSQNLADLPKFITFAGEKGAKPSQRCRPEVIKMETRTF